jgi:hypothetical protein
MELRRHLNGGLISLLVCYLLDVLLPILYNAHG